MTTQNRGVNITSQDFDEPTPQVEPPNRLQIDLQNVIDLIETNTPHFVYASSSFDADNEDSLISSTHLFTSATKQQVGVHQNSHGDTLGFVSHDSESNTITESSYGKVTEFPPPVFCENCPCRYSEAPVTDQRAYKGKGKKYGLSAMVEKFIGRDKADKAGPGELYKINITQSKNECSPPRRFVFDLIEDAPKHVITTGTNTRHLSKEPFRKKTIRCHHARRGSSMHRSNYSGVVVTQMNSTANSKSYKHFDRKKSTELPKIENDPTRMDVYYFDHGNAAYYQTTDAPKAITTEFLAERTENYATKFWAELFGTLYIGCSFVTSFIQQLLRFIVRGIFQPLTISLLQVVSDYFLKPCLVTLFNSIVQPPLIFLYNISTSLRDLCDPVSEAVGYFFREAAVLCRAIRLFDFKRENVKAESTCKCTNECECKDKECIV